LDYSDYYAVQAFWKLCGTPAADGNDEAGREAVRTAVTACCSRLLQEADHKKNGMNGPTRDLCQISTGSKRAGNMDETFFPARRTLLYLSWVFGSLGLNHNCTGNLGLPTLKHDIQQAFD
jgi:hypothetical protein